MYENYRSKIVKATLMLEQIVTRDFLPLNYHNCIQFIVSKFLNRGGGGTWYLQPLRVAFSTFESLAKGQRKVSAELQKV